MILAFTRGPEREPGVRPRNNHRLRFALAVAVALTASLLPAAELVPGLAYLRPGQEAAPLKGSAVIDLRHATDENAAAPVLAAIQPGEANPRRVVLALVSPDTSAGLRNQLAALSRCITIGRAADTAETNVPAPDIVVSVSAETDRRAFDALVEGVAPETLLVENTDKTRFDESTLIREHAAASPEEAAAPTESEATDAQTPPPLTDPVLQTAVHIYRGLSILKKL